VASKSYEDWTLLLVSSNLAYDFKPQVLSTHNMSRSGTFNSVKMELARNLQRHPGDVGSPEVVGAHDWKWRCVVVPSLPLTVAQLK